jgi:hypothetical protein
MRLKVILCSNGFETGFPMARAADFSVFHRAAANKKSLFPSNGWKIYSGEGGGGYANMNRVGDGSWGSILEVGDRLFFITACKTDVRK